METINKRLGGLNCHFHRPYYEGWNNPAGALVADPACHALMTYALQMKINIKNKYETIKYEETGDIDINHRQLWKSIATSYGVEPEEMLKYWGNVDRQLIIMGSPSIPEIYKMRGKIIVGEKKTLILPNKGH